MSAVGSKRKRADSAADAEESGSSASAPVFTVYVEGLPYTSSEDELREFFLSGGIKEDPVSIRAPRYQDSGRLMGYAHVDFATKDAAKKALGLDGKHLGGRFLRIQIAKQLGSGADSMMAFSDRPRPKGCSTLFVKGLPYETDEEAVKAVFSRFGNVTSVRLARWNHTGRLKGFGYLAYEHGYSAEAAVKAYKDGIKGGAASGGAGLLTVGGRPVHLDWDEQGAPKGSFKTTSGQNFLKTEEAKPLLKEINKKKHIGGGGSSSSSSSSKDAGSGKDKEKKGKKEERSKAEEEDDDDADEDGPASAQPPKKKAKKEAEGENGEAAAADEGEKKKRKKKRGKGGKGSKAAEAGAGASKGGDGSDSDD